eukprot:s3052_g8.t1
MDKIWNSMIVLKRLDVLKGDELPLQRLRLERLALQILRCQDGLRQLLAASRLSARGQVLRVACCSCLKWFDP